MQFYIRDEDTLTPQRRKPACLAENTPVGLIPELGREIFYLINYFVINSSPRKSKSFVSSIGARFSILV